MTGHSYGGSQAVAAAIQIGHTQKAELSAQEPITADKWTVRCM